MPPTPLSPPEARAPRRFAVLSRQLPFVVVVGTLIVALAVWQENGQVLPDAAVVALAVTFAATVVAAVVPWHALPRWAEGVVPLADIVAVAFLLSEQVRASVLLLLPVLWLARMGRGSAVAAVVAGIAASTGFDVVRAVTAGELAISADNLARLFFVPSVIVAVAVSLHMSERRSAASRDLLAGQSALVEELLEETSLDRARIERVLDTIDAGVAVLDRGGTVAVANRALREATAGDVRVGTRLADVAPRLYAADGETPLLPDRLLQISRGQRVDRQVLWWEQDEDRRYAFRVSAAPLPGGHATGDGSVVALHDITDELLALAQRDDFVSSVSHELRTPLTSVTGYLDLAADDPDVPEHVRGYLAVAERNAARLRILIDNLLDAARTRADAGTWELVDLRAVVDDVVESQTPRAADRDISVAVDAAPSQTVRGDVGRLTQVVDNVVSNAVKYSDPGGHVHIRLGETPDGRVRLSVLDDGPGIDATAQTHLFSRFYRAPEVRNTPVQGTGLGLHISRQIVEAMGGSIALRSTPGEGTCVDIHLPGTERP